MEPRRQQDANWAWSLLHTPLSEDGSVHREEIKEHWTKNHQLKNIKASKNSIVPPQSKLAEILPIKIVRGTLGEGLQTSTKPYKVAKWLRSPTNWLWSLWNNFAVHEITSGFANIFGSHPCLMFGTPKWTHLFLTALGAWTPHVE
jgi:hypothetical protein